MLQPVVVFKNTISSENGNHVVKAGVVTPDSLAACRALAETVNKAIPNFGIEACVMFKFYLNRGTVLIDEWQIKDLVEQATDLLQAIDN